MTSSKDKSLMRNLGEFFGHIVKGIKTDPRDPSPPASKKEVRREVEEVEQDNVILRRTTIEEIEYKQDQNENERPNQNP